MSSILEQFTKARKVGVPLVGVETPDPFSTIRDLLQANGVSKYAAFSWDIVRGLLSLNKVAEDWLTQNMPNGDERRALTANPTEALAVAVQLPDRATLFFHNAHRYIENAEGISVVQAVCNLRDEFKSNGRTLVLLAPVFKLPSELEKDIVVMEEELAGDTQRQEIVCGLYRDAGIAEPDSETLAKLVDATRGLASFPTEQVTALALSKEGVDAAQVWNLKRKMIEQTKGLSLLSPKETFDDIGGLQRAKNFGRLLFNGNAAPSCIVFLDEIEKSFAGSSGPVGDSSGVSQDFLGVILSAMEDNQWTGQIAIGPPGSGKSMYAKALGATYRVPVLQLDLGAVKGSLVGQSEQQIRQIMRAIKAFAGERAFFVGTCNKLDTLPPELRRRFRRGIWFFDLPDAEEQDLIWQANLKKFSLSEKDKRPEFTGFTGADIRNICENAWGMRISLQEASTYITPVAKSDPDAIKRLRELANNRFLSASYPGFYQLERKAEKTGGRRIEKGE